MNAPAFVLSVLTLNVGGPRRAYEGQLIERPALSAALKAEHPDAAAFQEVWLDGDAGALAETAGHTHRAHEPELGLAVTSRMPIVDRAALDLGDGSGVLRVGLDLGGTTVDVYSARIKPGALAVGMLVEAAGFVRAGSQARPFVLLGDLASAAGDQESRIFLDLLGARDLCVSHGDEMCGRTFEDRRVDYALIPYSSRRPREPARTAFTGSVDDERPARFGLAARLDREWLRIRLAPAPEGRDEALTSAFEMLDAARIAAEAKAYREGWLPWLGMVRARRARDEAGRLAYSAERVRSALARDAKPNARVYD